MKDRKLLTYQEFCQTRSIVFPKVLVSALQIFQKSDYSDHVFVEGLEATDPKGLAWIVDLLGDAIDPLPENLLPILRVDESSVACAVCLFEDELLGDEPEDYALQVVRWHIGDVPAEHQGELLDRDAFLYLESGYKELAKREDNRQSVMKLAKRYHADFVTKGWRPKSTNLRPVQLACQNVIVGLATLSHDSFFDGLRVPAYATCEVPHLAANEGDRALIALLLCDAFQNGGTMEIRFGSYQNETPVPPSLKRYSRALGIKVGDEDECAVTPIESRNLFLAVTPMPDDLRGRSLDLIDRGIITPERLCFSLMSGIWSAVELDYIFSTSSRVSSILQGGSDVEFRRSRLAELETCRAAMMTGMLIKRLENSDAAAGSSDCVRVFEDEANKTIWSVSEDDGIVAIETGWIGNLPWSAELDERLNLEEGQGLLVVPRSLPTSEDCALVSHLSSAYPNVIAVLLTPNDMRTVAPPEIPVLSCPLRMGELDLEIEKRLTSSRVGRS